MNQVGLSHLVSVGITQDIELRSRVKDVEAVSGKHGKLMLCPKPEHERAEQGERRAGVTLKTNRRADSVMKPLEIRRSPDRDVIWRRSA